MKVTPVCCQNCGADLEVNESIRFVTCNFCGSKLEVVHDPSVTHTRVLEQIDKRTSEMSGDLKVIRLQNELERLDREWADRREALMVSDKNGNRSEPSVIGPVVVGVVVVVGALFFLGISSQAGAPPLFSIVPMLMVGLVLFSIVRGAVKASDYRSAANRHETRRASLLQDLERAKRGG